MNLLRVNDLFACALAFPKFVVKPCCPLYKFKIPLLIDALSLILCQDLPDSLIEPLKGFFTLKSTILMRVIDPFLGSL